MIFSNIVPMQKPQKSKYYRNTKNKRGKIFSGNRELVLRGAENYSHPKLREMQRYGTRSAKKCNIINDIYNDRAVIIEKENDDVKALVRHSNRYYIVIANITGKYIKTFLPYNIPNFLDYVQQLMDKENSISLAA